MNRNAALSGYVVDYFPYGKILRQYVNADPERYLTTQHERDQETGLDYRGARYYDSDVAHFLSLDPKAMDYASWSAYNYVMGNPISLTDPDGKGPCPACSSYDPYGDPYGSWQSKKQPMGPFDMRPSDLGPPKPAAISVASGGISGKDLDVTFKVNGIPAGGLQAIQTFYGERSFTFGQVGTYSWSGSNGTTMDGFVDGGVNSPYAEEDHGPAQANKPYYLTSDEAHSQVTWSGNHGSLRIIDLPAAVNYYNMARFETAIVATNYKGTGTDTLLGSFQWGWNAAGTQAVHNGISLLPSSSSIFDSIVKHDYPKYNLLGQ